MIIKKIFNNNAILTEDSDKHEFVVMGCGIAFKRSAGDEVDENLIEKTFILKQKDVSEKFKLLLENIPTEHVALCYDIIEYAKNILGVELNDYIYVTLTDHISYSLKMFEDGINATNPLVWEIKKFYPKEFQVGLKALQFIETETGKKLHEDEAGNIALHLINAQVNGLNNNVQDVFNQTKMIQDILNIVKYTYNISLDENSLNYERFITHLRFFFHRLSQKRGFEEDDDFLLKQIKAKYRQAYECMLRIEKYLEMELPDSEKLYLTVHIQRVTQR